MVISATRGSTGNPVEKRSFSMKPTAIKRLGHISLTGLFTLSLSIPVHGKTPSSSAASKQAETATPTITVMYTPAETERGREIQGLMERTQSYEQLTAGLNQVLLLPESLTLNQAECGMVNAYYSPADRQIVMCYELVDYFLNLYAAEAEMDPTVPPPEVSTTGALGFVMLHELGHALIDLLDIPIFGQEEDAADQFAAVILSRTEIGHMAAQSTAVWFHTASQQQDLANIPYWDEHALDIQRFFNVVCMLYGSDPATYSGLMQELDVPERRTDLCQQEYQQAWENWRTVLAPHLTPVPVQPF